MAKIKLSAEQKKANKAAADKAYRERKKAEALKATAKAKPAPKKAKAVIATPAVAQAKKDAEVVMLTPKKPLRIYFSQRIEPKQSQISPEGVEIKLVDTGRTHVNEAGKTVKIFRFRKGIKRTYYVVDLK